MRDRNRGVGFPAGAAAGVLATALALVQSHALAAETCAWTRTPSGADFGTCASSGGRTYCVSCQYAPRVCVRTPC